MAELNLINLCVPLWKIKNQNAFSLRKEAQSMTFNSMKRPKIGLLGVNLTKISKLIPNLNIMKL